PRRAAGALRTRGVGRRHPLRGGVEPGAGVPGEAPGGPAARLLRRGGGVLPGDAPARGTRPLTAPSLFGVAEPLAARMRPRTLDEMAGQGHLLAPGHALGDAIRRGDVGSIILWGPPGT